MKNIITLLLLIMGIAVSCSSVDNTAREAWEKTYPEILSQIKAPEFNDTIYDITEFGAIKDDAEVLNQDAINAAIDACSNGGGGTVLIPEGTWYTKPIQLKSNVNLHIAQGGVLYFPFTFPDYNVVLTRWEGIDCYNTQPLIYAYKAENIAITGKGTIDGGASMDNWWSMAKGEGFNYNGTIIAQRNDGRKKLTEWNEQETPVEERILKPENGLRPQLVNLYDCKNILINDITLTNTPFWVIHPVMCENTTIKNITIKTEGAPNGDGIDPESCKNMLIDGCYFDTGDDCIAIKSGRNQDGRRWNIPSENIVVRNCQMKNGHGGVVIGSEISGGYNNLFVEDCIMDSPMLDRVIRIKTNNGRGGEIKNIYVRNVEVGQCNEAVLKINLDYDNKEQCTRNFPPTVSNVYLDNVNCNESKYGICIIGYEDTANIFNINVNNCTWNGVAEDNSINGLVDGLNVKDVLINNQEVVIKANL